MLWWGWGASHGAPSLSSRLFLSSNTSLRAPREYVWQNDVAFYTPRIDQTASQIHNKIIRHSHARYPSTWLIRFLSSIRTR